MADEQSPMGTRTEKDSLGELQVPAQALWGAQTQRAINNFPVSGEPMPAGFIRSLALLKAAAAQANAALGELPDDTASAIAEAALAIHDGGHADAFPVDVYQTGSGTSTNMNANEVIARLAADVLGQPVHPNDDVNRGQSSNDVIPSALHISARLAWQQDLQPALASLQSACGERARELSAVVKTGRTHLMDAMPITLGQEIGGWQQQVEDASRRLDNAAVDLGQLAIGGTAVGTGVNAHPEFAVTVCRWLSKRTGCQFTPAPSRFAAMSSQDAAVAFSGQLRGLAVALMKIANDLRWMNSGPLAGLGEIELKALQPGSSIMPGKVNPVLPEAVAMACAQVIGLDTAVTVAGQSGNFQLNVMLPLVARNLLQSVQLMTASCRLLADSIAGFSVRTDTLERALSRNPILVTALNDRIGYSRAAEIAKKAYAENRPVLDVAAEMTDLDREELQRLLDPAALTGGLGTDSPSG